MPTYEYACDSCGHQFETFQSMKDDPLRVCPKCEQSTLRRLIFGGTGVIFKGSGFYVNDSKKSSNGSAAKSGTGSKESKEATSSNDSASTNDTAASSSTEKKSESEKKSTVSASSSA